MFRVDTGQGSLGWPLIRPALNSTNPIYLKEKNIIHVAQIIALQSAAAQWDTFTIRFELDPIFRLLLLVESPTQIILGLVRLCPFRHYK